MTALLREQERAAYLRGDTFLSEMLDELIGLEEVQTAEEALREIVDDIEELVTTTHWRTGKKAELRKLIESIHKRIRE